MNHIDEKLEPLGNNISVLTSKLHKFSTDTLLLADFANPSKCEKAVEFGTGCGTIPLFWCTKTAPKFTLALEIQKDAFDLAKRSVDLNKLTDKNAKAAGQKDMFKELFPEEKEAQEKKNEQADDDEETENGETDEALCFWANCRSTVR